MEELAVQMYDDEFDKKTQYKVRSDSCSRSSSNEETSPFNFDGFKEFAISSSRSFSPRRIISIAKSLVRLSKCKITRYSFPPKYAKLCLLICANLRVLLPSFIRSSHGRQESARELHPSAWLDGLRGLAAFFVVIHHTSRAWFSDRMFAGWGSGGDGLNQWFIQLPIIRIVCSGYPQVAIFFVISGYAISYKPMKLLHSSRPNEFLNSLAMSVFRRHMRLFLPAAGVMFGSAIMTQMDWFGKGGGSREPPHMPGFMNQTLNWAGCVVELAEPFSLRDTVARYQPPYDPNLWTLPVEFRNSMIVFVAILALSKTRNIIRLSVSLGLIGYCLYRTYWDIFLFISGMLLADLKFRRQTQHEDLQTETQPRMQSTFSEWKARNPKLVRGFWTGNFILALWIVGMPEVARGSGDSPGFMALTSLIPEKYLNANKPDLFWIPIAAVYLVFVIDNETTLQSLFTNSFAQYLGKISFALYMVHGPILYTLGWDMQQKVIRLTGQQSQAQYGVGILLTVLAVFPVIFWVSDITWRLIDKQAVAFARWVSERAV